jgi:hypothetical protein
MLIGPHTLVWNMDDVSRLLFLFFMKNKNDAVTYIKEYVEIVNTQQPGGVKVQQMHSDGGGGEFINKNLDKFLKDKGVKQTVSTPHIKRQWNCKEELRSSF